MEEMEEMRTPAVVLERSTRGCHARGGMLPRALARGPKSSAVEVVVQPGLCLHDRSPPLASRRFGRSPVARARRALAWHEGPALERMKL
jgi:hypothetical protein